MKEKSDRLTAQKLFPDGQFLSKSFFGLCGGKTAVVEPKAGQRFIHGDWCTQRSETQPEIVIHGVSANDGKSACFVKGFAPDESRCMEDEVAPYQLAVRIIAHPYLPEDFSRIIDYLFPPVSHRASGHDENSWVTVDRIPGAG